LTRVSKPVTEAVAYFNVQSRQSTWRCTWSEDILQN